MANDISKIKVISSKGFGNEPLTMTLTLKLKER